MFPKYREQHVMARKPDTFCGKAKKMNGQAMPTGGEAM